MILTGAIITWDLTHNELPAEGVQSAQGAVASEGWMATMDNQSGEAIVLIHDVSDPSIDSRTVAQPLMQFDSPFALYENYLVMANETELRLIDVEKPNEIILQREVAAIESVQLTSLQGVPVVLYIADDALHGMNLEGDTVLVPTLPNDETIELVSVSGIEILMVSNEQPSTLRIGTIGASGSQSIFVNASTTLEQNLVLEEWGQTVDEDNATIVQVAFNSQHIAVRVNVTALDRMVLYDRSTGSQWLGFDPIYPVGNISLGYDYIFWEAKDHYNPQSFTDKYGDWEIHQLHLLTNYSEQLTSDTIDQVNPLALEDGIAYIEVGKDGEITMNVLNRGTELATYSSIVLQWSVIILIVLTFIYILQRQDESRFDTINHDSVLESE